MEQLQESREAWARWLRDPNRSHNPNAFALIADLLDGFAEGQPAPAAVAGPSRDPHPEKCPITGRPFFMTLDHPELGVVPTYGGPYDSHTIPAPEGEPTDPWHERDLRSERYDHDAGWWVEGGEHIPLRIVHEDVLFKLQADAEAAQAAPQQEAQEPYSIDADPQGIRAVVADAVTGALAFGAQGSSPPQDGHWLTPFWEMARGEAMRTRPASASSDTLYLLRRLLSNQHTLTGPEFRAELEKVVGEAYQQEAQERVYLVNTGVVLNGLEMYERHEKPVPLADCELLYTAPQPAPADQSELHAEAAPKDHELRELVNRLRDIAREFHGSQQLRERIAAEILPMRDSLAAPKAMVTAAAQEVTK